MSIFNKYIYRTCGKKKALCLFPLATCGKKKALCLFLLATCGKKKAVALAIADLLLFSDGYSDPVRGRIFIATELEIKIRPFGSPIKKTTFVL
jgi:hypothetical protein